MGCGSRVAGTLLALLAVVAIVTAPVVAQPPGSVPPQGTIAVAVVMSDGTTYLPVSAQIVAGIECGPRP
jgi:hypothetical protein